MHKKYLARPDYEIFYPLKSFLKNIIELLIMSCKYNKI